MRLKEIQPFDVCLIKLNGKRLTLILQNDKIVRFTYPSEMEASGDLRQWRAVHLTEVRG
jgi:hypothetical protein